MLLKDGVRAHPKVLKAGAEAAWLWACCIDYSRAQLTDGFVPSEALPTLANCRTRVQDLTERLVSAGLLHREEGGVRVHDYLQHNDDAVTVREKRRRDSTRKRNGVPSDSTRNPDGIQTESDRKNYLPLARARGVGVGDLSESDVGVTVCETRSGAITVTPVVADVVERLSHEWPEFVRRITGARGRFRPALDGPAVVELAAHYPEPRIWQMAEAMLRSEALNGKVRNPVLLAELAPELDRWLLEQGR